MAVGSLEGDGSLGPEQEFRIQDMTEGRLAGPEEQTTSPVVSKPWSRATCGS